MVTCTPALGAVWRSRSRVTSDNTRGTPASLAAAAWPLGRDPAPRGAERVRHTAVI